MTGPERDDEAGSTPPERDVPPRPLDLGELDLVPEQTSDDTDAGWGAGSRGEKDPAAVLRRYLDETPPHHGG
jgi:hypothetical protein